MENIGPIGEEIKNRRKQRGLTQWELAVRIGCSQATLSNYENGHRIPTVSHIKALAIVFRQSPSRWFRLAEQS